MDRNFLVGCVAATIVACTFFGTIAAHNINVTARVAEAIVAGAEPLAVQCALDNSLADFCVVLATNQGD
jgi:hypothetical protein